MSKKLIIFFSIFIALGIVLFAWNLAYSNLILSLPQSGDTIGNPFVISGEIPTSWIDDSGFGIDVLDKNGNSLLSQLIFTPIPQWWSQFIITRFHFMQGIYVSGTKNYTKYTGPATLIISNLYSHKHSYAIPIIIK